MNPQNVRRSLYLCIATILLIVVFRMMPEDRRSENSVRQSTPVDARAADAFVDESRDIAEPPTPRPKRPAIGKKPSAAEESDPDGERLKRDGPELASTRVHTLLAAGQSLVTGGYAMADGSYEFALVTPAWVTAPNGERQVKTEIKVLRLEEKALMATGLSSLVTPERKTQQNAELWSPHDVRKTLESGQGIDLMTAPGIVMAPGIPAQFRVGSSEAGNLFGMEIVGAEGPDGGFDLKVEMKRIDGR